MTIWQLLARTTFTLLFILATGVGQGEELGAIGDSISTAMNADDLCDDAVAGVQGTDHGFVRYWPVSPAAYLPGNVRS
ncbi:MAG: hypothetical protein WBM58_11805 [Sedimenticolaceae bacterium]